MSTKMMARVWALEDEELEGARLLTLLSLANHANVNDQAWPSIPTIAKETRVSDRQVQRSIQWLGGRGYIKIAEKGNGRGKTTIYNVLPKGDISDKMGDISDKMGDMVSPISEELTPVDSLKGDISDVKGDIGDANYSHALREPIQQPTEEKKESNGADAPALPKPKEHKANQAFRDLHKRWPSTAQMQIIMERDPPIDNWVRAIRAWAAAGFKPTNVEGMLDWAFDPSRIKERTYRNGASNGSHRSNGAAHSGQDNGGDSPGLDPELQRQMDEHRAKRKAEGSQYYR